MTALLGQWRATYAPGEWIVLSGPTSLVVMQPFADEWSALVGTLWEEVLASSSLIEIATTLAAHGIDDMPHFGAFFWTAEGMRSMVRGDVRVVDLETGATVADGQGFLTWSEIGLGHLGRIRVEMPLVLEGEGMELPLVVGAVRASYVVLDADPDVRARSPQAQDGQAQVSAEVLSEADLTLEDGPPTEADPWVDPDVVAEMDEMENADTELMQLPPPAVAGSYGSGPPDPAPEPVAPARLILSDGNTLDLDRPVRIGRAPSADAPENGDVLLVTVLSPNQDISRNHLQLTPRDGEVLVSDLRSTNGTILVRPGPDLQRERLSPGEVIAVPVGSLLELGDGISILVEPLY